jgi:hypothetical protein
MNHKFISLKSVLADLSAMVPQDSFNETLFYEWSAQGLNKIRPNIGYRTCNAIVPIIEHTAVLPNNFQFLNSAAVLPAVSDQEAAYYDSIIREMASLNEPNNVYIINDENIIQNIKANFTDNRKLQIMHKSSSVFLPSFTNTTDIVKPSLETPQYQICDGTHIMTNVRTGFTLLSYMATPSSKDGDLLIPDNQDLKEAIYHYVMYRWYSSKIATADYSALNHLKQEREFHLSQFQVLSVKSKNLELPDLATLENLVNIRNRMVSVTTAFENGFNNINTPEKIAY